LQPEDDSGDGQHAQVVNGTFLAAGGDAAKLLQLVHEPLHQMERSIGPVGAKRIELRSHVKVKEGVNEERARKLPQSAERYCSTQQTPRDGVEVETDSRLE
jgi:hypothetical protein